MSRATQEKEDPKCKIFKEKLTVIEPNIGRGSFGTVHKVMVEGSSREYALKEIKIKDQRSLQDVRREIHMLEKTKGSDRFGCLHHNICASDHCITNTMAYILMPLYQGQTLRQWLKSVKQDIPSIRQEIPNLPLLGTVIMLEVMIQIATGLANLHSVGLVHRDLKPDNIMITENPFSPQKLHAPFYVSLIDLGLTCSTVEDAQEVTCSKEMVGTLGYLSPEVVRSEPKKKDEEKLEIFDFTKIDIFSLGCTFYELCTGKHMFDNDSQMNMIRVLQRYETDTLSISISEGRDYLNLTYFKTGIPALDTLIFDMVNVDPATRPSARDVLTVLSGIRSEQVVTSFSPGLFIFFDPDERKSMGLAPRLKIPKEDPLPQNNEEEDPASYSSGYTSEEPEDEEKAQEPPHQNKTLSRHIT